MKELKYRGLTFGIGHSQICVPLTAGNLPGLLKEIICARALPGELLEWRIDHFSGDFLEALPRVEQAAGDRLLLCTLRTRQEGGRAALSTEEYERAVTSLITGGHCSMVDIEWSSGEERVARLLQAAKEQKVLTVVSKHDFDKTPPEQEIFETLLQMKRGGGDLPKYAVMPHSPRDVLALLSATERAYKEVGPVITMSMGGLGKTTRAAGGLFGSCLTFAAGENASAPGQIGAEALDAICKELGLR